MEEEMQFRHALPVQLRFSDVDQFGHVNNSVYFSLYDLAKTTYFTDIMNGKVDWHTMGIVVANVQANFLAPIFFSENIAIQTATTRIGNKSFTLCQQVINVDTKEIKCICQTVMVGYDIKLKESQPIPDECKKAICKFEGNESLAKEIPGK
ncbi:MAG: thioesterase family protein [Bacteroides sp.]